MTTVRPKIVVARDDHEKLIDLALHGLGRAPGATLLLSEMERATVIDRESVPLNVIGMNDAIDFEYDGARYRDFRLVYPQCADIVQGNVSVMTPVGAALIGVAEGDSMWWPGANNNRIHRVSVTKVARHAPVVSA